PGFYLPIYHLPRARALSSFGANAGRLTGAPVIVAMRGGASSRKDQSRENRRRMSLRHHPRRGRGGSGEDTDLPLHGLPDRDRLGVPRLGAGLRHDVPDDGRADELPEDDGGKRQSTRAGVLPALRLAHLFDHAGRASAAVVHGAGRHPEPARPVRAEAAELVPLGAVLGDRDGGDPQEREAGIGITIRKPRPPSWRARVPVTEMSVMLSWSKPVL